VPQMHRDNAQASRIQRLGRVDQDGLGVRLHPVAQPFRRPGDHRRMRVADLAFGECLSRLRQVGQLSGDRHAVASRRWREIALPAQPGSGAECRGGVITAALVEPAEPAIQLGIDAVAKAAKLFQVLRHGACRESKQVLVAQALEGIADVLKRGAVGASLVPEIDHGTHVRILPNSYSKSIQKGH
jgi:hypothetical protein